MRTLFLLLLVLAACGGGGGAAPGTAAASAMNPPIAPGECFIRCENMRPTLERDFGITRVDCGTSDILGALSNTECNCIFTRRYGLLVANTRCLN